jgi:hypothetical protein
MPAVLRIRIHLFLGILNLNPDPSVRGMDSALDLDPSITKQKVRKTLIPDFLSLKMMYMYLQKVISKKTFQKISFLLASWEGQ